MLSWLRRRLWPTALERYTDSVGHTLDWWLLCLRYEFEPTARSPLLVALATRLHGEGASVREATCTVANSFAGDLIAGTDEEVRAEVLAYLRQPEVNNEMMKLSSANSLMLIDTLDDPALGGDEATRAAVLKELRDRVLGSVADRPLSPRAQVLFAGVRHLFGRMAIAFNSERQNERFRHEARRLHRECFYALEGISAEGRQSKHTANVFLDALENG